MIEKVLETIERFSLLEQSKTVTVALSGGADSMALLCCLLSIKDTLGITVKAAHLNHLIRGDEAFRDEEFVKRGCEALGVELVLGRIDVPSLAEAEGESLELAARKARYKFLEEAAGEGVVATAHSASDNLETVILNLSRGSAADGLSGIPPKRGIFIRPLIVCTRADIENYCKENNIDYVTDSTNLSDDYTRNKIRHSIVPVLKEINPSVENTVLRGSLLLREDSLFLEHTAKEFLNNNLKDDKLCVKEIATIDRAVAKRIIKVFIEKINPKISAENIHIENALQVALNGGKTSLPKNYSFVVLNGFAFVKSNKKTENKTFSVEITEFGEENFKKQQKINNLLLNSLLDCDRIIGKLVIRSRQTGDSIRLLNRGCTKSLNKLYNENAIPVEMRDNLPVIADDNGVVWIYKIGVAQRCAVKTNSKRILCVDVKEEP